MFLSNRAFKAMSSSSTCAGEKLLRSAFRAFVGIIAPAFNASCLLPGARHFFARILHSYQFAISTPFVAHPIAHPRQQPPDEYAYVPSFPSLLEWAEITRELLPQTSPAAQA